MHGVWVIKAKNGDIFPHHNAKATVAIVEVLHQLLVGQKTLIVEPASSPLKFGSLPAGSIALTAANGSSSMLSASSRGIRISEKPNLNLSPHEVILGLNKDFSIALITGNHSEHTTTAVVIEELVLNVDKNIAGGVNGVKFSDIADGEDDNEGMIFGSFAASKKFLKELQPKSNTGSYSGAENYGDHSLRYNDYSQRVDGQIVTDEEGSRLCIKNEALLETMYQSKDPKSLYEAETLETMYEAEMLENLFNCLCGLLMPLENRDINARIKEETNRIDVGDSSLGAASLKPLKLIKFAKQAIEQLFGRADILESVVVYAIFINALVLVGTHDDQLFSYYNSRLMKYLRELAHVFDIKGQMEMTNKLCEKLLKEKGQASIAMAMVAEVSTQSLAQSILVSILPQLIKGSTAMGVDTEIKCGCLDILCNVLHKFGNIMTTDHELLLGALLSQLSSNQTSVRKTSVSCIASLALSLLDDLLVKATVRVVQHLSNKGTKYKMTQTSLSQPLCAYHVNSEEIYQQLKLPYHVVPIISSALNDAVNKFITQNFAFTVCG